MVNFKTYKIYWNEEERYFDLPIKTDETPEPISETNPYAFIFSIGDYQAEYFVKILNLIKSLKIK